MGEWKPIDDEARNGGVVLLQYGSEVMAAFYDPTDKIYPWVFLDPGVGNKSDTPYLNGLPDDRAEAYQALPAAPHTENES